MLINYNLTGIAYGLCMNIWELIVDADHVQLIKFYIIADT